MSTHNNHSPTFTLYYNKLSYYSQLARVALLGLGGLNSDTEDTFVLIQKSVSLPDQEHLKPPYAAINPNLTVPALQTPQDTLIDSRDIIAYTLHLQPSLADTTRQEIEDIIDAVYIPPTGRLSFRTGAKASLLFRLLNHMINTGGLKEVSMHTHHPILGKEYEKQAKKRHDRLQREEEPHAFEEDCQKTQEALDFLARKLMDSKGKSRAWLVGKKYTEADGVAAIFVQWVLWNNQQAHTATVPPVLLAHMARVQAEPIWTLVDPVHVYPALHGIATKLALGAVVTLTSVAGAAWYYLL